MSDVIQRGPSVAPRDMIRKTFDAVGVCEVKALDEAGSFSGYANPFGKLDSVGDITMPGAFIDAIPAFLQHGFFADNHDWAIRLGWPTAAAEDAVGLYCEGRFHGTQRAQDRRIEASERMADGLSERWSIGFTIAEFEYVKGADAVQYLIAPTDEEIARCAAMARVRLIHKVKQLFEVSFVSVPAAPGSDMIGVKSDEGIVVDGGNTADSLATADTAADEAKGIHLGDGVEEGASVYVIENLINRYMWRVVYDVLFSGDDTPAATKLAMLGDAIDEMREMTIRIVGAILDSAADTEEAKADIATIIEKSTTADGAPRARRANEQSVEALAAVADHIRRERVICGLYLKEGRRYSRATTERLIAHRDILRERADDVDAMLREGMPEDDDQLVIVGGKSADPQTATTTEATAEPTTDEADASPEYIDPEIANGIYAAFITEHGE
jgi:HK97 family phage prohead protease